MGWLEMGTGVEAYSAPGGHGARFAGALSNRKVMNPGSRMSFS
jgi:hypothetical protein